MPVRITGLNSGLDTDAIVKELVNSYSIQKDNITKKQTKLEWKQDAWKELNTKIYNFYSSQLSNMRLASAYKGKSTTSSDESKVKVTASNSATLGSQTVEVTQLAQASYLTGSSIRTTSGEEAGLSTKLSELGINGGKAIEIEVDGKVNTIAVSPDDSIEDMVKKFKDAGLNASFDTNTQRFFVSSKESGKAANFKFVSDNVSTFLGGKMSLASGEEITIGTRLEDLGIAPGTEFKVNVKGVEKTITVESDDRLYHLVEKLKDAGVDASFNQQNQRLTANLGDDTTFKFESDGSQGSTDALGILGLLEESQGGEASIYTENKTDVLSALGLLDDQHGGTAVKVEGQDAIIKLNGAEFTSSSNNFSINGLEITATGVTQPGTSVSIVTNTDTKGIYDSIKSFFKEYNELIKEMDTLFNADNAKGYEPLTDAEKDDLSDKEVEKWEKKIKDSLLRRDSTLGSVADAMKTAFAKSYTINGKSYSLASFGINTQSYLSAGKNEKYLYHIDGDKDDSLTKSNEDKLMKALTENPEDAAEFFSQLVKGAYEALDKKMKSTSLSSAYVVYNDKQMKSDLKEYDNKIDKWEEKVKYYEDFYYKKFSAMEKAMANLQSSQNSLSMLLGQ